MRPCARRAPSRRWNCAFEIATGAANLRGFDVPKLLKVRTYSCRPLRKQSRIRIMTGYGTPFYRNKRGLGVAIGVFSPIAGGRPIAQNQKSRSDRCRANFEFGRSGNRKNIRRCNDKHLGRLRPTLKKWANCKFETKKEKAY